MIPTEPEDAPFTDPGKDLPMRNPPPREAGTTPPGAAPAPAEDEPIEEVLWRFVEENGWLAKPRPPLPPRPPEPKSIHQMTPEEMHESLPIHLRRQRSDGTYVVTGVISRMQQDLEYLTQGKRAATYPEIDESLGYALLAEGLAARWLSAEDAVKWWRAGGSEVLSEARPSFASVGQRTGETGDVTDDARPDRPTEDRHLRERADSFRLDDETTEQLQAGARAEGADPVAAAGSSRGDPAPDTLTASDDAPESPEASRQSGVSDGRASPYPRDLVPLAEDGAGDIARIFLERADEPDAPAWLKGHLHEFPLDNVVENFTRSGDYTLIEAVRDKAIAFAKSDPERVATRAFADRLTAFVDPGNDIVVLGPKRKATTPSPAATARTQPRVGNRSVTAQLPAHGLGFRYYGNRNHQFATEQTIGAINDIAHTWSETHATPIQIGEISRNGGGRLPPHGSHRNGTYFDIRPFRTDGRPVPVNRRDPAYDQATTLDLLRTIRQRQPNAVILFNDPEAIRLGLSRRWRGHDNHIHVRLR